GGGGLIRVPRSTKRADEQLARKSSISGGRGHLGVPFLGKVASGGQWATRGRMPSSSARAGFERIMPNIAAALGSAYVLSGRFSEAVMLLERARDRTAGRTLGGHALLLAQLGEAYLPIGRIDAKQARPLARPANWPGIGASVAPRPGRCGSWVTSTRVRIRRMSSAPKRPMRRR